MLTVHHLNNSRSQRVLWLLEELGVPYEIVRYQRQPDMRAPAELRAVHPLGKSPVITDNGNTIAESGAIVEYLIDTYGEGRLIPPPKTPERLRYTYWLHYAEGSAMPPLLLKLLRGEAELVVGDNEPYAVSDETDYTIPVHGEARGLMNSGIEIRQDLIAGRAGQSQWAERLARIFGEIEIILRAQGLV